MFLPEDLLKAKKRKDLITIADEKELDISKVLNSLRYEEELKLLQIELVNLQRWVIKRKLRVAIIFEGRDAAGKGGAIKRFTEHLNPRSMRVVALSKPTDVEEGNGILGDILKNCQILEKLFFLTEVGTTELWLNL